MAKYTFIISKEHNTYPNITVYDRFTDGEASGWRVEANEGYAFYDTSEKNTEIDPDTLEETSVKYYYTLAYKPRKYNWDNFNYVAVPIDDIPPKYFFGG